MIKDFSKIVLVDDDADDRMLFKKAIEDLRIKTDLILFENGFQLMDFVNDHNNDMPSIIFLDLNMPVKNGFDCLKELRSNERTKNTTIAIYSTSSSEKDVETTFINGANVYINKPFLFDDLKNVINRVLTINWQYFKSNLNRETFLLKV